MSQIPDHVVQHLIATGILTPDGTSRRAKPRPCRHCRRMVIVGLDDDRCAMTATTDPDPLTPAGELTALLTGRATYTLTIHRNNYQLDPRDQFTIAAKPAGTQKGVDTVAAHVCGAGQLASGPSRIPPPISSAISNVCPF